MAMEERHVTLVVAEDLLGFQNSEVIFSLFLIEIDYPIGSPSNILNK